MTEGYKICSRCIMDTVAVPDITFDEKGVCNYCTEFLSKLNKAAPNEESRERLLDKLITEIKEHGKNKEYDCILGVSGGVDSSYALYKAIKLGLRPLAVHLDNGWNSELSVKNIEVLVRKLNVDLYTYVIDWEEFKDLQIAFFKANVIDIEMLTDHAIFAALYKVAFDRKIKHILTGVNTVHEGMRFPPGWIHYKIDLKNIKAIYKKFGSGKKIKSFPMMGIIRKLKYKHINRIQEMPILNYLDYDKDKVIKILSKETGWKPYEKKHYESVFTRFYQAYILPKKFNVDKRKLHYSSLICSGQMSREDALELMEKDTYDDPSLLKEDKEYVLKKLNFSNDSFDEYLSNPSVPHNNYSSNGWIYDFKSYVYNLTKNFY